MACAPPWGVPSVMGHFAANKAAETYSHLPGQKG